MVPGLDATRAGPCREAESFGIDDNGDPAGRNASSQSVVYHAQRSYVPGMLLRNAMPMALSIIENAAMVLAP